MKAYQKVRAIASFEEISLHPELIVQITLQPVEAFDLDAAIVFSDILFLLKVLDVEVSFPDGQAPQVRCMRSLDRCTLPSKESLHDLFSSLYSAISLLKHALSVPLIGFSGAAWTLVGYLLAGTTDRSSSVLKKFLSEQRQLAQTLFSLLEEIISSHLIAQLENGCQVVQLFDSWANEFSAEYAKEWIVPSVRRVVEKVYAASPNCRMIYYSGLSVHDIKPLEELNLCFSVSSHTKIAKWRQAFPTNALQGNLDPTVLLLPKERIVEEAKKMVHDMKQDCRYIANLGHGVLKETPEEAVHTFVRAVRGFYD